MKIAVIGAGNCGREIYDLAENAGFMLAQINFDIICGGLGGVMEAVCKGAKKAGGTTIGILPGDDPTEANDYVDHAIATGMGIGRNIIIIRSAPVILAIDGRFGTLSEISFALQLEKPVVALKSWSVSEKIRHCDTIEQTIAEVKEIYQNI